MSNWTHVAGIIRINGFDCFCELDEYLKKYDNYEMCVREMVYDTVGHHVGYGDDPDDIPMPHLPMGSEGSLNIEITVCPINYLEIAIVTIYGDLRDDDSAKDIVEWFKGICKKFWIRQAMITATNGWFGTESYVYGSEVE